MGCLCAFDPLTENWENPKCDAKCIHVGLLLSIYGVTMAWTAMAVDLGAIALLFRFRDEHIYAVLAEYIRSFVCSFVHFCVSMKKEYLKKKKKIEEKKKEKHHENG